VRTSRAYRTELDDAYVGLLEIATTTNGTIRLTDYDVDVVSDGLTYTPEPFQVTLPDSTEDAPPQARLIVDNVNRVLIEALRTMSGTIPITLKVVLASDPDTIEIGPFDFSIRGARWGATVECDLAYEPILSMAVPADVFGPADFPGLFR
jgi:hypothetical protein